VQHILLSFVKSPAGATGVKSKYTQINKRCVSCHLDSFYLLPYDRFSMTDHSQTNHSKTDHSKEYASVSMHTGKLVRLNRLFSHPSGRFCSMAVDHFIGYPEGLPAGLRHIARTLQAIAAGRLLDIPVLDHIVIAGSTYISLRERGVAFDSPGDQERLRRPVTSEDPASSRGGPRSLDLGGAQ